jgi:arginine-tRNA-protein transferase
MPLEGESDFDIRPRLPPLGFVEQPRACSYLPSETASLEYRLAIGLTPEIYGQMLRRGWRRHGVMLFRPQCPACIKCRSLRVPVERFAPSKSQRRTWTKNDSIHAELRRAEVTPDHVDIYNAYHAEQAVRKGWPVQATSIEDYSNAFLAGDWEFAHEIQYRAEGKLIGVGLVDVLPDGLSSVYFYHDPDWRKAAIGKFSILCEIDLCRRAGIPFLYLGYWIEQCASMAYKSDYQPHEMLMRYVEDDEEPEWEAQRAGDLQ